jgi:UDP-N-acetylmuramoyl-L-alanyl-D-glutamate--2,6-diaminopimelate ligase
VNADDAHAERFMEFPASSHHTFGIHHGDTRAVLADVDARHAVFDVESERVSLHLGGEFNVSNALAAITVAKAYGIPSRTSAYALASVASVEGRMQWIQREPFGVVVDYAHTPDSLEAVYRTLRAQLAGGTGKLICVLGAAGGGRDVWKRPLFGALAATYCDRIVLTDEDPFEEDPASIIADVRSGIPIDAMAKAEVILDRKAAIETALTEAKENDIIVITGKGSETSMAIAGGRKVPWSDAQIVRACL